MRKGLVEIVAALVALAALAGQASPAAADGSSGLEKRLFAWLLRNEGSAMQLCVSARQQLPAVSGFDDIEYAEVPGAHRVVLANASGSPWDLVDGYRRSLVLAKAGFYSMQKTTVTGPNGEQVPAFAFELTRGGFERMTAVAGRRGCFVYGRPKSVRLYRVERMTPAPAGVGGAIRVYFTVEFDYLKWADTPAFRAAFIKGHEEARTLQMVEADGELLSVPQFRRRQWLRGARGAGGVAAVSEAEVRADLASEAGRRRIEPCLPLPTSGARIFWPRRNGDTLTAIVLERAGTTAGDLRTKTTREFFDRLAAAKLAREEPFTDARGAGAPVAGVKYIVEPALVRAMPVGGRCLPLGAAEVESLFAESIRTLAAPAPLTTQARGWARVAHPYPWTGRLARRFKGVAYVLRHGYGFRLDYTAGEMRGKRSIEAHGGAMLPQFAATGVRKVRLVGFDAQRLKAFKERKPGMKWVDLPGRDPSKPLVSWQNRCLSDDGTTVYSIPKASCSREIARTARAYVGGKVYAEITFISDRKEKVPNTWTNAAFTSQRGVRSLTGGVARVSFAGDRWKRKIESGDTIGVAADLDAGLVYWNINGKWNTGLPGSGVGETVIDVGAEHFFAFSVQGGNEGEREGWRINVGGSPFKYPLPPGYVAYDKPGSR